MAETLKGVWIPKKVSDFEKFSCTEKVFISDALTLSHKMECIANNVYFSERLKITKESASHMINKLVRLGYLQSTINFKPNTKRVESRILKVNKDLVVGINEDNPLYTATHRFGTFFIAFLFQPRLIPFCL